MTASERLRELDGAMTPFAFVENESGREAVAIPLERYREFQRALPLIADCIEAAERMAEMSSVTWMYGLDNALTALREHLEGGDGT